MKRIAHYKILNANSRFVLIKDLGPWHRFPTITNSAKEVVRDLYRNDFLETDQRIFYYDEDEQADEILHDGKGRFLGFSPGTKGVEL